MRWRKKLDKDTNCPPHQPLRSKRKKKLEFTRQVGVATPSSLSKFSYDELFLSPKEVTEVEHLFFRYSQSQEFAEEISILSQGGTISKNSSIKKLLPFWDEDMKVLKHQSRIVGYQPIILPKDHLITRLYIHYVHQQFGHSGPSLTLYKVRKRVWVTSGRLQVKKAI